MNYKTDIKTLDLPKDSLILVVDDTKTNLEIVFNILSNIGFNIITENNGESAIKQVESRPPDLIILDVMMPRIHEHGGTLEVNSAPEQGSEFIIKLPI